MRGIVVSFVSMGCVNRKRGSAGSTRQSSLGWAGIEAILSPAYLPEVSQAAAWVAAPMPAGVSV